MSLNYLQIRVGTLKEQVDQIRFERQLARDDYHHYGGCGYPNPQDERILIAYIQQLENKLKTCQPKPASETTE